jgi:predicted amidohydrolase YtcJ
MWKEGFGEPETHRQERAGVVHAGRIVTMVPGLEGEALWWQNGKVQQVGKASEIERDAPRRLPRYELKGALVTPGLTDGHTHLALWALNRKRTQLAGLRTREQVLERVARAQPDQGWIIGQGWDANGWSRPPDRASLDQVQHRPVYLDSLDVHAAWLNSAALSAARISRDTPDPFGGRIVRDANGEPTGLLLERAVELVQPALPRPTGVTLETVLLEAQAEAHRLGLTGIHNVEGMDTLAAFRRLDQSDRLRLRVLYHPPVAALSHLIRDGVRSGQGTEWLTLGGVKMFLDGSLGSRTAWMLEPYEGSHDCGLPLTRESDARDAMTAAAAAGLTTTVHAIGDAAVRRALDLTTGLPALAIPHRIEHFQCVHPVDLDRAASHRIALSMQPAHLLTDIPLVERHWGRRGRGAYAFRSLLRRGARLVFGSDVPVASLDPREGIYAAMERQSFEGAPAGGWHPEEKLGLAHVLGGYTLAPAEAAGWAGFRGRLGPGFDADLVAWKVAGGAEGAEGNAFREAVVVLTVVDGRVVFH